MDGPPAARRRMRRPSGSGHMRRQAAPAGLGGTPKGPPLPEGSLAGRATLHPARLPGLRHTGTGSGHIPKIQSLSDAPTGKGFQSQPPRGGRLKEPPGRPQREYSHRPTRGTAANPPSPPSRASPPPTQGTGSPLVPIGGGPPSAQKRGRERRRHPLESGPAARAGSGSEIGVRLPRFAGFRRPSGKLPLAEESRLSRRRPRRPRGERHPARLPGKGTAATCRTASGFRPRPLP